MRKRKTPRKMAQSIFRAWRVTEWVAREQDMNALDHLGNLLVILSDLHPDDRCMALDEAQEFYNALRPNAKIESSGHGYRRLVRLLMPDEE